MQPTSLMGEKKSQQSHLQMFWLKKKGGGGDFLAHHGNLEGNFELQSELVQINHYILWHADVGQYIHFKQFQLICQYT